MVEYKYKFPEDWERPWEEQTLILFIDEGVVRYLEARPTETYALVKVMKFPQGEYRGSIGPIPNKHLSEKQCVAAYRIWDHGDDGKLCPTEVHMIFWGDDMSETMKHEQRTLDEFRTRIGKMEEEGWISGSVTFH